MSTKIHVSVRNAHEFPVIAALLRPLLDLKGVRIKYKTKDGQSWHLYIDVPDIPKYALQAANNYTNKRCKEPGEPENEGGCGHTPP